MTLTFDRKTLSNRTLAPVLTAFVLSGLLGIVTEDTEAAESSTPGQTEYGSPVRLSQKALRVLEAPFTPYLETDTHIMRRAVRFPFCFRALRTGLADCEGSGISAFTAF